MAHFAALIGVAVAKHLAARPSAYSTTSSCILLLNVQVDISGMLGKPGTS
jgi:hypothetical protein